MSRFVREKVFSLVRSEVLGQEIVLSHEYLARSYRLEEIVLGQKGELDQKCSSRKECSARRDSAQPSDSTRLGVLGQVAVLGQKR
ncbi:hypothetical protein ACOSP7_031915 [Xanthoceras sorbifolium]